MDEDSFPKYVVEVGWWVLTASWLVTVSFLWEGDNYSIRGCIETKTRAEAITRFHELVDVGAVIGRTISNV